MNKGIMEKREIIISKLITFIDFFIYKNVKK